MGIREHEELEAAINTTSKASLRFPDHAAWPMIQAKLSIELVQSRKVQTTRRHELLASAADSAIKARNLFRKWKGPSRDAVALAASALLALGEPRQVLVLARPHPQGEATPEEAAHGPVVECAARALLLLGRHAEIDELDIDNVDPSGKRLLLALQAASSDDPNAVSLMRTAVEHADPMIACHLCLALQSSEKQTRTHCRSSPKNSRTHRTWSEHSSHTTAET